MVRLRFVSSASLLLVLLFGLAPTALAQGGSVLIAKQSGARSLYHRVTADHLPVSLEYTIVERRSAEASGMPACPVCYPTPQPNISNYAGELALAYMVEREVRAQFPILETHPDAGRVRALGTKVLQHWGRSLKGYRYRFYVVDGDAVNAFAAPTGYIHVTTGMLDILETDEELEAILAHEISHVERRHGFRQYQQAQDAALLTQVLVLLASDKWRDELSLLADFATALVITGYSRDMEREADLDAVSYLEANHRDYGRRLLLSPLQKFADISGTSGSSLFMDHPSLKERIRNLEVHAPEILSSLSEIPVTVNGITYVGSPEKATVPNYTLHRDMSVARSEDTLPTLWIGIGDVVTNGNKLYVQAVMRARGWDDWVAIHNIEITGLDSSGGRVFKAEANELLYKVAYADSMILDLDGEVASGYVVRSREDFGSKIASIRVELTLADWMREVGSYPISIVLLKSSKR